MAKEQSPAFQFYPRDFLSDENVMAMELDERGAYITLMCVCWTEGSIPADVRRLARICGCPRERMAEMWEVLSPCFEEHPGGPERLVHPRLEAERTKQAEWREKSARGGRKSAEARKRKAQANMNHRSKGGSTKDEPKANTSVCSLQSATTEDVPSSPLRYEDGAPPADVDSEGGADVVELRPPSKPLTLRDHQNEAARIVKDELWLMEKPPARFGPKHSMANELSIWNALAKHDPPEDVNGAMLHMRKVGRFGKLEALSLLMFNSKNPQCRALYAECLAAHRKAQEVEAAKDRSRVGNVLADALRRARAG